MEVDGESYKRYSSDGWVGTRYFDIISEDYDVGEQLTIKLEKLFQEFKDLAD